MPGYDRNRIVGVNDHELDEFTCSICLGIFDNPVATQCCRQTFCKDCIREWVSQHKTCPNDRKTLTKKGLKPVPRVVVNLMENMKIKCNYEMDGCSQVVRIGELTQHLTVCEFRPNQLCKTCGLIKESVLNHNCIHSLISEKRRTDEKYIHLLDENSSLLLMGREKDEIIGVIRQQLTQLKVNHQRDLDRLKADNLRALRDFKMSYAKAYEDLRDYQANEMEKLKATSAKQEHRISELKWEVSDREERLARIQRKLNSQVKENLYLTRELDSCKSNMCAVKVIVICVGICLFRYFY